VVLATLALLIAPALAGARHGPRAILPESGNRLVVVFETSGTIGRVDAESGSIELETPVGDTPFAVAAHPDGYLLYVTCRYGQEVVELERESLAILRRFPLVGEPAGIEVSTDGTQAFVALHSLDQVAVLDLESGEVTKRLSAGNGPLFVRRAPGNGLIYVTNLLARVASPLDQPHNELTVIDEVKARVVERLELVNANIGREIAFNADGSLGVMAVSRPKNLVPAVQVARGWMITNGFALVQTDGIQPPLQLLVDLPNESFADVYASVWHPSGEKFYLSASGVDKIIAVDLSKLREVSREIRQGKIRRPSDHLGLSRGYVSARIEVGANPVGMAVSPDERWLFVANRLGDSISVIETDTDTVDRTFEFSSSGEATGVALGERVFHSAERVFQKQFSCSSCHPEGGVDGLQYDLEPDGIGQNILDNRNLRDVEGTAPFKWVGTNPDIATQCGTRTAKWIVRTGWLTSAEVVALADYIQTIPPSPNPYRSPTGRLTKAQRRGKRFFERTYTNSGEPIPLESQCHFCHSGGKFTNQQRFDVGTMSPTDTKFEFDSAHLNNVFESAPYLHDGRSPTLEEIWTVYNPDDRHGISSDWTKQQLNDLVEYLKCLSTPEELP
jgi:DNA-binding beta-propeller fold protein YncE